MFLELEHIFGRAFEPNKIDALLNFCDQVFDGHGGVDAALYIRRNILKFIVEDNHFPTSVDEAIKSAYLKADHAFADTHSLDSSSGTTALTALIFGRQVLMHLL